MKIVYLDNEMDQGGAETVARTLMNGWRAKGHDVHLVLTYPAKKVGRLIALEDRIPVTELNLPRAFKMVLGLPKAFKTIAALKPDAIIINNHMALLPWAWLLKTVTRGGVFVAIHNTVNNPSRGRLFSHKFLPLYSKVISIAQAHSRYCMQAFNLRPDQIRVVHNGIESCFEAAPEMPVALPEGAITAAICARLNITKDHANLFHAVKQVVAADGRFHLIVVGDGPESENLRALAKTLALEDHIHFTGWTHDSQKFAILNHAQMGLLSSVDVETLPISVLEYMRAGLPVISTLIGSLESQVLEGKNGFLVPQGDPKAMADAILKLLRDPAMRERFGAASKAHQLEEFSIDGMLNGYLSLFEAYLPVKANRQAVL
jgi:glycosyltransferase involved in cell wall biosynthesis